MTVSLLYHLLSFWFTLIGAFAWHLLATRKSRGDSFFGVRVEAGFEDSETGSRILGQFRMRLWSLTALAALAAEFLGAAGIGTGILLSFLAGGLVFAQAHRMTLRLAPAQPAPVVRRASIAVEPEESSSWLGILNALAMIVPPVIPAIAVAAALNRGSGDRALWFFLVFALFLGIMCAANQWALRFRARSTDWALSQNDSRRFRTYLGVMFSLIFTAPIGMISLIALLPDPVVFFATFLPLEVLLLFVVWRIRFWLTKHLDPRSIDPMPDSCWKWGWYYCNPSDPALVVPLRTGVGHSFNCGHPGVKAAFAIVTTLTVVSLAVTTVLSSQLAH